MDGTDFLLGGIGSMGATLITNPLEVVKTRMQLQGELAAKGTYHKPYRSVVDAFITVAKKDGYAALQKGLAPSLCFQFILNSCRLGIYNTANEHGLTKQRNGHQSILKSAFWGATGGFVGSALASPFFMLRTHLQSQAKAEIAVGGAVGGTVMAITMTPPDVIATRLYNQGVDAKGKGIYYNGVVDCFIKILKSEGVGGLYKGFWPHYMRIGPHATLVLLFFDELKSMRRKYYEAK
ncbi:LOW QUALITY PROTEIN: solute carrier family 25 member 35-like [Anopheles moucheti]|uniref:LOW QUALITY PROTEIN: solute carrier family 25 member 35-like n=1 Tax=Anopheles moucheti TaxID=186751 RepID=UPI0022F0F8D2|nr:LOW QUALITY PROTEIN: solute carrier family 25 member 35-like [Anopheles moucheti]